MTPHSVDHPAQAADRRRLTSRDLALVAVFVGVMAALGLVPAFYPFGAAVPITAQSLGVMLAGAVLGARRGALSMVVFVVLVAAGLPLLAGGVGGLGMFATPRAGFLLGFPAAAYVVGRLTERHGPAYPLAWGVIANVVGGILVLYVFGILGIMAVAQVGIDKATTLVAIFIPGDLLKAVVAGLVARGVHAGYPGLLPRGGRVRQANPV
ncbi:MAG: Substrate-specific component BioY of biotin ECF transporter [uncultured Nocardioidaceae bacterium]|uniref:Biotin transporter n=1 Tax=uncultured Nocardioidaceae bacterium TaxID=253824 RepID=A0A6J4LB89_9ACTN|nr:MAG: Substrate-specific component BioY of biotin ECF transporter [uncultured Nocardioidaceae bacterium]